MEKKTIILVVALLVALVVGMVIFAVLHTEEGSPGNTTATNL